MYTNKDKNIVNDINIFTIYKCKCDLAENKTVLKLFSYIFYINKYIFLVLKFYRNNN